MASFCPECGTARESGAETCGNCDYGFDKQSEPVSADDTSDAPLGRKWLTPKRLGLGVGAVALASASVWVATSDRGIFGLGSSATSAVDVGLLPVSFGGKCGYVDASGKMVINPQYDNAEAFNARLGLAPVFVGGKWGLIDREGKYVINPQFDLLEITNDNRTIKISQSGKFGTIDESGKFIINPQFADLFNFDSNGRAIAKVGGHFEEKIEGYGARSASEVGAKYGVIDSTGKYLVPPEFDFIQAGNGGNAEQAIDLFVGPLLITQNGKYGFADSSGKIIIQPQFSRASPFSESGYAAAAIGQADPEGLSNLRQRNVTSAVASLRRGLSSVLAGDVYQGDDGTLTFTLSNPINATVVSNWISQNLPDVWRLEAISYGVFSLSQQIETPTKDIFGYIDRTGKFTISPQYSVAGDFSGAGLAVVQVGTKYGFIDTKGKIVINPQYYSASQFVKTNRKWLAVAGITGETTNDIKYGLIDTSGKYIINPQFDSLENFYPNGYAIAQSGDLRGLVDTNGKYVIQPVYSTLFKISGMDRFFFVKPVADDKDAQEIGVVDVSGNVITTVRGGMCAGAASLAG